MKLGKKTKTEKGTFMAYASCSCTCFCVCKCQNCHSIGEANGTQIANDAQYNTNLICVCKSLNILYYYKYNKKNLK